MSDEGLGMAHRHFAELGYPFRYDDKLREHFVVVRDDAETELRQAVNFCPICGEKLPESLRGEWFDRLESLGVDPMNEQPPAEYTNGSWWRSR